MSSTLGDLVLLTTPRVVGVGEIVSWPEYRRATLKRPAPVTISNVRAGDTITLSRYVPADPEPKNRHERRKRAAEHRK